MASAKNTCSVAALPNREELVNVQILTQWVRDEHTAAGPLTGRCVARIQTALSDLKHSLQEAKCGLK